MDDLDDAEVIQGSTDGLDSARSRSSKLLIVSYGHSNGPLTTTRAATIEQLTFSVRDMENPPVKLRKTHTGLSARLRKEIFANQAAQTRLETIVQTVESKMMEMERYRSVSTLSPASPQDTPNASTLLVGIMCEEGKHRSTAFAEELARKIEGGLHWTVSVEHRDLNLLASDDQNGGSDDVDGKERTPARKSKRQREQERRQGRSSAAKFVRDGFVGYGDSD